MQTLIRVLRQYFILIFRQKSYGWVPLYIVRCGEGSLAEKSYYLNYFEEKYQEFKNFNYSLPEFVKIIVETQ